MLKTGEHRPSLEKYQSFSSFPISPSPYTHTEMDRIAAFNYWKQENLQREIFIIVAFKSRVQRHQYDANLSGTLDVKLCCGGSELLEEEKKLYRAYFELTHRKLRSNLHRINLAKKSNGSLGVAGQRLTRQEGHYNIYIYLSTSQNDRRKPTFVGVPGVF